MSAREIELRFPGLPADLDGLRIAQLTDIHFGAFLGSRELARAVGMANEWRPHLAALTGDFITDRGDPLDECLQVLAGLRSSDGVYACCGNHEAYARAEAYCTVRSARLGIHTLRGRSRLLRFGASLLNLAGVDHQRDRRNYLAGADRLLAPGAFNLLLSHNPDVFPVAARQGFPLVLAGHTHGGQLALEAPWISLSLSRFFTPFVGGLYRLGQSQLYVSRGIGTVGVPMRLGVPPEVTLIRLRAA
jgi:predicted MPP superfamily phosphohydrolase